MATYKYDEDVYENNFFMGIISSYPHVLEKIVSYKGMLCVPKFTVTSNYCLTKADAMDHVLLPVNSDDQETEEYISASGKNAVLCQGKIRTCKGYEVQGEVSILFSETFHTDSGGSYRVLCMDGFLNRRIDKEEEEEGGSVSIKTSAPTTYQQCMDLLWTHSGGQKTKETVDKVLNTVSLVYERLEGENLRCIVDAANSHFAKAMQLVLKDSVVRKSVRQNSFYMDSLKLAVETYVMNFVYKRLFRVITAALSSQDSEVNKITRNLGELQLSDLGVKKMFSQNLPPAKKELSMLNRYSTPIGRLFCIKRTITVLAKPPKKSTTNSEESGLHSSLESETMMTSDDLLPILIFLIVKSEIPNWYANLVYMRHFHFAKSSDDDEFGFYLATIEAALEHIRTGNIQNEIQLELRGRWNSSSIHDGDQVSIPTNRQPSNQPSIIQEFFSHVQEGNEKAVEDMLEKPVKTSEEISLMLCHPLCSCERCDKLLSVFRTNSNLVTAYTRDHRGYTALHMAAYYGQGILIDLLVRNKAAVDATDYLGMTPLHLACQRGYQNVMLLLLHFSADVMATDNEGNTPLHFACVNGHEDCVKALLFYDGSVHKLQVNATNEMKDTALHLAAKWGFEGIVKALLENGAHTVMCNRKNQTPVSLAQNVRVQRLLQMAADGNLQGTLSQPTMTLDSKAKGNSESTFGPSTSSGSHGKQSHLVSEKSRLSPVSSVSSQIETASLDEESSKERKKKTEKLFRATIEGDIQLVKFYLGVPESSSFAEEACSDMDQVDGGEVDVGADGADSLGCHPLCQCHKCRTIQRTSRAVGERVGVDVRTSTGSTLLHTAVLHNHSDIVELLLSLHAHTDAQNHKSLTPLHLACCMRNSLITDLLVKSKAELNLQDMNGDTPLLIAASNGFINGVYTLIKAGADLNLVNRAGNSALHEAAKRNLTDTITLLVKSGIDVTIRNKDEKLASHFAEIQKNISS